MTERLGTTETLGLLSLRKRGKESIMPIYEYECTYCGKALEIMHSMDEKDRTYCEICRADTLRKIVSASSFRLKGTGWYETDFKDKK